MKEIIILLLPAIMQVESSGRVDAVGDGGRAIGAYQIHKAYWLDGCDALGVDWPYKAAKDPHKAAKVVAAYLAKYGRVYELRTGRKATPEVLARIHNGGPAGYKYKSTNAYWLKVKANIKTKGR